MTQLPDTSDHPPTAALVLRFDERAASDHAAVGGKGANLARLARAGFAVPPGIIVTTSAYAMFIAFNGLDREIPALVDTLDYGNVDALEARTGAIRALIERAALPPSLSIAIASGYAALGDDVPVAVRSSGTAEDLAEASFAGQHDTYLHIRTVAEVLSAVKRCWASLWTARATAYRHNSGIDHLGVAIAVVIQEMVDAEVAGVLFTGNPSTTATDEAVINASWGLGEAIVAGVVTPDEFTVGLSSLRVKDKTLGDKAVRTVRDPHTGIGTVSENVPDAERARFSLSDAQASALTELGRQVMEHYAGFPQDIEWALRDGRFYLLQSRPITGVEFAWEADLETWQVPEDEDVIWTRTMSDMVWTGAVTPLFFTTRGRMLFNSHTYTHRLWGLSESSQYRYHKYWKATPYYNTKVERAELSLLPPAMRAMAVDQHIPPPYRSEAQNQPFSYLKCAWQLVRIRAFDPAQGIWKWVDVMRGYLTSQYDQARGPSDPALRQLSDLELLRATDAALEYEDKYIHDVWNGFIFVLKHMMLLLAQIVASWYDGDNPSVMVDLNTGQKRRSKTMIENLDLWHLANEIRHSKTLLADFAQYRDGAFFTALEAHAQGRAWLKKYSKFLAEHGHRGHSDRDIYFPRRADDPAVDYRSFQAFLAVEEAHDPAVLEEQPNARRKAAFAAVLENIRAKPFGRLKAGIFKVVCGYIDELRVLRDDHRHFVDVSTYTYKRAFVEIGRRVHERVTLEEQRDFYFLGREELYDLLQGGGNVPLLKAKIAARKRNFDRLDHKDVVNPMFLCRNRPLDFDSEDVDEGHGDVFRGSGSSRGTATGTARVLKTLNEIGRVQKGDILVVNATDPGWTPVFLLISGLILEGGGILSHGASLSREYGMPAVQLPNALRKIPDGATITINGDTGLVTIVERPIADGGNEQP